MLKVKLNVLGLSVSQTQTGAYALVLVEENGDRRIPIIIGPVEAQSIAIQLEGLHPPRPLTHDLFKNISKAFQIELLEVIIYKLEAGIFYSEHALLSIRVPPLVLPWHSVLNVLFILPKIYWKRLEL
jgi:bifunctional DNase/RNase